MVFILFRRLPVMVPDFRQAAFFIIQVGSLFAVGRGHAFDTHQGDVSVGGCQSENKKKQSLNQITLKQGLL